MNSMLFQQNLGLLSLLLKGDHEAAADRLRQGTVQVSDFDHFVSHHRLRLFLFFQLDGSGMRKSFPRQWLDEMKRFSLKQWRKQEILLRELRRISALLTAAGHGFLVLKGPYFAERFFGGIDHREFSDLDILIQKEDVADVEQLLFRAGYTRKSNVLISRALTCHFTHALDFVKPNVALDLHWVLSANAAHALDYNAVWLQRQTFVLDNRDCFVLSDEYEVVFSLISIFKDLERGAARLKAFVDLYFILSTLNQNLNWASFLENRKRERILKISVNVLALFLNLLGCAERFPEVTNVVGRHRRLLGAVSCNDGIALLEATPGSLKNKLWAAHIYDCSRAHVFLWWLTSLPFRLAVHDRGKHDPLRRRVQQTRNGAPGLNTIRFKKPPRTTTPHTSR